MIDITGYADKLYARPGESIAFKVSCTSGETFRADIVQLICGDTNPDGPGFKEVLVETPANGAYPARFQPIQAGSYAVVEGVPALPSFSLQAFIWPTLFGKVQTIACLGDVAVNVGADGALTLAAGEVRLACARPMLSRRWYRVDVRYGEGLLRLSQTPLAPLVGIDDGDAVQAAVALKACGGRLGFAARLRRDGPPDQHFNGKIDAPKLFDMALADAELAAVALHVPAGLHGNLVAAWDFSRGMGGDTIHDASPNALHGRTTNLPARAMKGWNWTGEYMDWKTRPEQWGAIHFHGDDLYDAAWATDFSLTVPETMRSGLYAARLRTARGEDYVPFTVTPAPGQEKRVALLLPNASYLAYSNDHLGTDGANAEFLNNIVTVLEEQDLFLHQHWEFGGSLYDSHADGSGVCYSSRLRPTINMRPKTQNVLGGFAGSRLWQFNADTHITDWLEASGQEFDVITDEELDARGYALLAAYDVVITGSHPEYVSTKMWDALEAFKNRGGRLMYLGGDGFYWRVAFNETLPGVVELRRAESGIRAWTAEPGEYYHSFDGAYGGLWARQGRSPHSFVGVGFAAQGFDISSYYRRNPDSYRPEVAFIFDGIGDEKIGDFGLMGGGAAGLELDRAAPEYGTPPNALILASSVGHTDTYLLVPEEIAETTPALGGHENQLVRADMVFLQTPHGGAVFATGSIAWAGSLAHNGYDNNVARITGNVLRRFLDPAEF